MLNGRSNYLFTLLWARVAGAAVSSWSSISQTRAGPRETLTPMFLWWKVAAQGDPSPHDQPCTTGGGLKLITGALVWLPQAMFVRAWLVRPQLAAQTVGK